MTRLRVLQLAESANPEWTSGPLIGWAHSRALAEVCDAHLVTQVRNREALERAGLVHDRDFTAIDSEWVEARLFKLGSMLRGGEGRGFTTMKLFAALGYYEFERQAWKRFEAELRDGRYDVVHRITPVSPTTPSLFAKRCKKLGVPFVVGPLNGGVRWPRAFDAARRAEAEWLSYVRDAYRLLPGTRATRRHSSALVVGSLDTWTDLPESCHSRCVYVPENGIDPARFPKTRDRRASTPLRCLFVGRLVPYKGADMLIEAASALALDGKLEVDIVGDGPERGRLRQMIEAAGVGHSVRLHGAVPHTEVGDWMSRSDLLVLPSIREFGGGVVMEAMAVGLPPLVVDYGGPAELVTPGTGFRVELGTRDALVEALRSQLGHLVVHPEEIDARSKASRERVARYFTWERKAEQMLEIYAWVMGRAERPDWGHPFAETTPEP